MDEYKVSEISQNKCVICRGQIEVKTHVRNGRLEIYWDKGNNAQPVSEGQCCDVCNESVVLPARMARLGGF
tara:strand:- start:346 stop:558 length:213 start_codon:yes stop_codon:yes gene_type:complete